MKEYKYLGYIFQRKEWRIGKTYMKKDSKSNDNNGADMGDREKEI